MSHEHKLAADASSAVFSALLQASSDAKLERLRRLAVGTTLARGFQQPCWPRWATIKRLGRLPAS